MSGHNKWSSIKHKKGAVDAKRGKIFTKLSKELTVAARMGGGDISGNSRLRLAISAAKAASMPSDNIQRAIKKGTGELDGGHIEELVYEGYGPGGVAFILDIATDNQNRSISEIRNLFDKSGGNLAKSGAVAFLFHRRGMLRLDATKYTEEQVMEAALDAGAEDVLTEGEHIVVYTQHTQLHAAKEALEAVSIDVLVAESIMIPSTTVTCDAEGGKRILKMIDKLEDHDDVQNVWANYDLSDEIMAQIQDSSA